MSDHYRLLVEVLQERARFFSTYGAVINSYFCNWENLVELSVTLMNEPLRVQRFLQKYVPRIKDGKKQGEVKRLCDNILEGVRDLESLAEDYRCLRIKRKR